MSGPAAALFSTPEMGAAFAPQAHVQGMLQFEAALARAEAAAGVIPQEAAAAIAACCRVELFDVAAIYREAARAGTPAIPLVRMLTAQVGGEAQKFVHWGATSQDAIDTALMLQMCAGLDLLLAGLLDTGTACAALAERHRHTVMAGRTLLQQAVPITFGLKAARWLGLVVRQAEQLRAQRDHAPALQFGGAAGTLAVLRDRGLAVAELLAVELRLPLPDLPWHAERDRVATVAGALGVTAGALAKIAGDIVLLAQTEVGEVAEGAAPGKGGSSALPQKRNPVDAMLARAAARLALGQVPVILGAMEQEHERAAGGWQAEWAAVPDLFCYTAGALAHMHSAVEGLDIDPQRMQANLDAASGLLMTEALLVALAPHVGRPVAQRLVQAAGARAVAGSCSLETAARDDAAIIAVLSPEAIARALDPAGYLGSTDQLIDRALAHFHAIQTQGVG